MRLEIVCRESAGCGPKPMGASCGPSALCLGHPERTGVIEAPTRDFEVEFRGAGHAGPACGRRTPMRPGHARYRRRAVGLPRARHVAHRASSPGSEEGALYRSLKRLPLIHRQGKLEAGAAKVLDKRFSRGRRTQLQQRTPVARARGRIQLAASETFHNLETGTSR